MIIQATIYSHHYLVLRNFKSIFSTLSYPYLRPNKLNLCMLAGIAHSNITSVITTTLYTCTDKHYYSQTIKFLSLHSPSHITTYKQFKFSFMSTYQFQIISLHIPLLYTHTYVKTFHTGIRFNQLSPRLQLVSCKKKRSLFNPAESEANQDPLPIFHFPFCGKAENL